MCFKKVVRFQHFDQAQIDKDLWFHTTPILISKICCILLSRTHYRTILCFHINDLQQAFFLSLPRPSSVTWPGLHVCFGPVALIRWAHLQPVKSSLSGSGAALLKHAGQTSTAASLHIILLALIYSAVCEAMKPHQIPVLQINTGWLTVQKVKSGEANNFSTR